MEKNERSTRLAYSRESTAIALDCSPRWIDKLIEAGKIRNVKKEGRKILILEKSLKNFPFGAHLPHLASPRGIAGESAR